MQASLFEPGRTAVIFGGGDGIGLAAAEKFAAMGLRVIIADQSSHALEKASGRLNASGADATAFEIDVGNPDAMVRLRDDVLASGADISIIMNNAGKSSGRAGEWSDPEKWRSVFECNFWGAVHSVQCFIPALIKARRPAAIINTGSKQGITNPPGDLAYNCTKAALKTLTEGLQHSLRNTPGCQVNAHLLIPGFTYTGMMRQYFKEKPAAAWTAAQVVERLVEGLRQGDFYIICPDNETSEVMDARRIEWGAQDLVHNRPALSLWRPDYAEAFAQHMAGAVKG
jgi:NAD(P)-dependent dehydrogenase (short-subunit alcohol dehydrogenase family)